MYKLMKMGYLTATTFAALTLGTGIFTPSIAFSAEERIERVAAKMEKAADKLEMPHSPLLLPTSRYTIAIKT